MNNTLSDKDFFNWLCSLRHDFHQHPETAFNEIKTTKKIKEILAGLNIEIVEPDGLKTGVIALLRGKKPGKTIAIRADIDALPVIEKTNLSYASINEGVMHACGHDAHITIGLGLARTLSEQFTDREFAGNIKFIFQPAEETLSGANEMISKGALKNPEVDAIISLHVINTLDTGIVDTAPGPVFAAADIFSLTIEGKGAHAAYPHKGCDPILAGCDFINGCMSLIRRHVNPVDTCVITTGTFHAGEASNVIPNKATLTGSVRTYLPEVRKRVLEKLKDLLKSLELNHSVKACMELRNAAPSLINDPDICKIIHTAACRVVGQENIKKTKPRTGSEDFACYLQNVPGAMFFLGSHNPSEDQVTAAHSSTFIIDDRVLPLGVRILAETCRDFLDPCP